MAQPVWVLSVDLQTKTATFQTGLADAAKAARGSFTDIKGGAGEMGGAINYSMMEARHSVMILGEEFGVHLPRALAGFIASLGPIGPALEAAFPFLAIALGATLLLEHLSKMREAGEKLTDDQVKFGTAVNNAFNTLDEKIIQAQIKSDELRNNHLGALHLQLQLIDKQSMAELVHSFEEVAKAADVVMKDLEGHWYTYGKGSEGAQHALDQFQTRYDALLAQGKQEAASGLLGGTLSQAQKVLEAQKAAEANKNSTNLAGFDQTGDHAKYTAAVGVLRAANVGYTQKEVEAQQNLVDALQAQMGIEARVAELKKTESGNAGRTTGNAMAGQQAAAARESAESQTRMGEQSLAAQKATAEAVLQVHRASLEARLASDIEFAGKERDVQMAGNAAEVAGLDKSGKDYTNQLQALKDKSLEITSGYNAKVAEMTAKSSVEIASRDLTALEQGEREKIEATQQGGAARLTAINSAIKAEEAANLQDTNFFRELLNQRVETARQASEEEGKLREEAAKQEAESGEKLGQLNLTALKQRLELENSAHRVNAQEQIRQGTLLANQEYAIKMTALDRELAGLDKSGKEYNNKLKQLQDQEKQLTQQHENQLTEIKDKAEEARNHSILSAEKNFNDALANGLTQSLMGHERWSKMVVSFGREAVTGMMENAIKSALADDFTKEKDAAAAGRKAFKLGLDTGGPAGVILGPVFGAAAFTAVMAFQGGTDAVPGVGRGDVVPTMLEPGEGVVPGGVMDGLSKMARSGNMGGGSVTHVHVRPTYHVQTIDGDGMQAALEKHTDQLQRHFENSVRKMNR